MYDYKKFWVREGREVNPEMNEKHRDQEKILKSILDTITFDSVLEFGAGWGRMTKLIKEHNPRFYTAVDLSRERLDQIKGVNTVVGDILEDNHLMKADLVIASELLLHIPSDKIKQAIDNMKSLANKYVISIDYYDNGSEDAEWVALRDEKLAEWCFSHNYPKLYGDAEEFRINKWHSLFLWKK